MGYNLINIYNATNKTLFDDITLYDKIDKETLVNTIFDEAGELEPNTSYPDLFKAKVNTFFKRNYTNFKHIYDAFLLEYEPIENYNRISDITVTDTGKVNRTGNRNNTVTLDGTNTTTNDLTSENTNDLTSQRTDALQSKRTDDLSQSDANTVHNEVEDKVSAFNTSGYSPKDQAITDTSTTDTLKNTGTQTTDNTGTQTQKDTGTQTRKDTGSSTLKQDGTTTTVETNGDDTEHSNTNITSDHTHGNIGVTTSQQMLQSEIDLWIAFNAYKTMADYFIKELMITVL